MRRRRLRSARRVLRALKVAPSGIRAGVAAFALLALLLLPLNWGHQVVRKPAESFFPVSGALSKPPPQTRRSYAPIFCEHATATFTPDLLAALAQLEAAGNPVARTYWRRRLTTEPFDVYRPASSAAATMTFLAIWRR
ncbi:MAG TPA: hypothetical protein VLX30_12675 [Burkholderiales bacterium]|nr:hypothetical protein [Burkholderiales bacterium]